MSITNSKPNDHPLTIEVIDKKQSLHCNKHVVLWLFRAGCGQTGRRIFPGNSPSSAQGTGTLTMGG